MYIFRRRRETHYFGNEEAIAAGEAAPEKQSRRGDIMAEVEIRTIPAHVVYRAEYDVKGVDDFFDPETDRNILYDLQYLMEDENPDVHVPEDGEDYNYFEYPYPENPDGTVHIVYRDMVDVMGKDNADGAYAFEQVPEIEAAVLYHVGRFDSVGDGFARVYDWIEANGYEIAGPGRVSAIHGPWDRENPDEYANECQVPVRKK